MSIVRYNQRPTELALHDEIRQMFDRFFGEHDSDASAVVTSQWVPRVDIKEEAERFVLTPIPGIDPQDIEVQMDKGILSIGGERKSSRRPRPSTSRVERHYGMFHRRFALPDSRSRWHCRHGLQRRCWRS